MQFVVQQIRNKSHKWSLTIRNQTTLMHNIQGVPEKMAQSLRLTAPHFPTIRHKVMRFQQNVQKLTAYMTKANV